MADNPNPVDILLNIVDEAYHRQAWHGPNLKGSLRGISVTQAAWRPSPDRHNIWEILVHAAYWKYTVRRRLLGEKRGSFPLSGSNWFRRPDERTESALRDDLALLNECHHSMREAIAALTASELNRTSRGSKTTTVRLIHGIAMHDVYHAGQIQLLKRLQRR